MSSSSPLRSPRSVVLSGRYRILRKLGAGRLGTVYLAQDEILGRSVALKVIRIERLGQQGVEALQEEFRAIAGLHHPQIATAFDFGYTPEGRLPYYTREYIEGRPLQPGPPFEAGAPPPSNFLRPFFDLLDALHYLHSHEILHLDIHAGNLIEAADATRGSVLIDFGLLRRATSSFPPAVLGAGSSLPPELLGEEPPCPATDLHAVGRLLLYRLTGNAEGKPALPHEIPGWGPRLTLELERIACKALQREPRHRFQSASEFREALAWALGEEGGRAGFLEPGDVTVAREIELQAIEDMLRRTLEGHTSVIWLTGPAGIGKTRLLTEARLRAQLRGLEVIEVRFFQDVAAGPSLAKALGCRGARKRPPAWLSPLAVTHGGSTQERARRVAEAYFVDEGQPPLVLLLDDIESADRESRILAETLLGESAKRQSGSLAGRGLALMVASVTRPSHELSALSLTIRSLKPLSRKRAKELLRILLRSLEVPVPVIDAIVRGSQGNPLRLRQAARALHQRFGQKGSVPSDLPPQILRPPAGASAFRPTADPSDARVLGALAVLGRPCRFEELQAATRLPREALQRNIRRLIHEEALADFREGRVRFYCLGHADRAEEIAAAMTPGDACAIHGRVANYLKGLSRPSPRDNGRLALHLLRAGRCREGRAAVLKAAGKLREEGLIHDAIRLLAEASSGEMVPSWRLRFAVETSNLLGETGDHEDAVAALEPAYRGDFGALSRADAVGIRRRLGAHYHRAGSAERALEIFGEIRELADPVLDVEELILVESELAELHTLRSQYKEAEAACRGGLGLLARATGASGEFRARMEVMLRGSLGHLELRRMRLERAKEELEAAFALSRGSTTTTIQARILNNLGVVHNHLNDFTGAAAYYRRAKALLKRIGDQRGVILADANLATIFAKTGNSVAAREALEAAGALLAQFRGKRLEFFVETARGMVAHSLGDSASAIEALESALPVGRKLGDLQFVGFAEIYLSEALLACGRHGEALKRLRSLRVEVRACSLPALERMAGARLVLLGGLLGDRRTAAQGLEALRATPRTDLALLEAWNDLCLALAAKLRGEPAQALFRSALSSFVRLGVPAGARIAKVFLLYEALEAGDPLRMRSLVRDMDQNETSHRFLSVLEPLVRAEAHASLGERERAEECLQEAAGAIVGLPFFELDWRIEFLAARLAEMRGDREGTRRHLHRSIHTTDLLARSLPPRLRERFLAHARFAPLRALEERSRRPLPRTLEREIAEAGGAFEGMIGRSEAMRRVFRMIEALRDNELPVLITGEMGTGKELVATAIHRTSPRRRGPFLALHCASLPPELFESELFGYEAGAFTGAEESCPGLLEYLAGGTLLFDGVESVSIEMQTKLLRVVDSKVARALGGSRTKPVDVRFLAVSSADLGALITSGRFRADLYYRLAGLEIHVPPLRARKEDIPELARHFLAIHSQRLEQGEGARPRLSSTAIEALERHDWPGNVRELENAIIRMLVFSSPGVIIGPEALERALPKPRRETIFADDLLAGRDLKDLRKELERSYLLRLFEETRGDLAKMAKRLGVKVSALYHCFKRVGISIRSLRSEGKRPLDDF